MGNSNHWKPLQRAGTLGPEPPGIIAAAVNDWKCSAEEARKRLAEYDAGCEYWINDLYQVQLRRIAQVNNLVHLNIRRRDGAPIHDWRHLQAIKSQLIGEECEAIELYPAESRLVDQSNKYHLWGFADPTFRFPIAIDRGRREVIEESVKAPPGMRQRAM